MMNECQFFIIWLGHGTVLAYCIYLQIVSQLSSLLVCEIILGWYSPRSLYSCTWLLYRVNCTQESGLLGSLSVSSALSLCAHIINPLNEAIIHPSETSPNKYISFKTSRAQLSLCWLPNILHKDLPFGISQRLFTISGCARGLNVAFNVCATYTGMRPWFRHRT